MKAALLVAIVTAAGVTGGWQDSGQLAVRIVEALSRQESLTDDDYEFLTAAGDRAFPIVHREVIERVRAARKSPTEENFEKIRIAIDALAACATARRTATMVELTKVTEPLPRNRLYDWLAREGEASLVLGLFKKGLSQPSDNYYDQRRWSCVEGLVRIGDDDAVGALLAAMSDPALRTAIFRTIANTKNARALAAVRAMMDERRPPSAIPSEAKATLSFVDVEFPVVRTVDGEEWALLTWDGLGSREDLWIARKKRERFVDPVFTGMSAYWPMYLPGGGYTEGGEEHEAAIKRLAEGEWVERFVRNAALAADLDSDGYTDVVERWLGLDPSSADSDGDGVRDSLDRNPLTARRALSDEERALRVACEALVCGREGRNVFVEFPDGIKAIELQMHDGIVLPRTEEAKSRMARPEAVFGLRFRVKGPFMSGDRATVKYEEDGGYYVNGGVVEVMKIGGHWYPSRVRVEFMAIS
jgi:hypothetical protein